MRGARPQGAATQGERLAKIMAAAGIASRRACEELILEGRVEVDGEIVLDLGRRVDRLSQQIFVDGDKLPQPKLLYFAVHKPPGIVSTAHDPSGRPRVIDLLPPDTPRVFNVGRLDLHSEGLILVTNDGELANQLTHPRHGVEKTYHVHVAGVPDREVLAQLRKGMYLAEGFARVENVRLKSKKRGMSVLEMILKEGKNREIRRLLARAGHKVQRLIRTAVGPVRLGELPPGAVRPLNEREVASLRELARGGGARKTTQRSGAKPRSEQRTGSRPAAKAKRKKTQATARRTLIGAEGDAGEPVGNKPRTHSSGKMGEREQSDSRRKRPVGKKRTPRKGAAGGGKVKRSRPGRASK